MITVQLVLQMASLKVFISCILLATTCLASRRKFPLNFKFGAATSAYQIEGAWNISDKSESIWDRYAHAVPSGVRNGDSGDITCNSYWKYKEDIQMAADLGLNFYRMSISWPRLLPTGFPNVISEEGKKYYDNLIDGLLEKGIEPLVTIYHWDLPQRLQNLGGWTNPMITDWYADYARVVFDLYADRVKSWITINEPNIMCDAPYNSGGLAPGIKDTFGSYICGKHTMVGHAKAWRIYDKEFKPKYKGRVGISNQLIWFEAESPKDEELAELTRQLSAGMYSHPIFSKQGGWPPAVEEFIAKKSKEEGYPRSRLPAFTQEEIELIRGTHDFYALNYYSGSLVRPARPGEDTGIWPLSGVPEFNAVKFNHPKWRPTANMFMKVYPEGLRKQLVWLKENYGDLEYMISENGFASSGSNLNDQDRIKYLEEHLDQILLAIKEDGVNVNGYTVWSLMDNFEWDNGYSLKFGLYEVDFSDENRTRSPRASARYYATVIKNHSLDDTTNKTKPCSDEF